MMRTTAAIIAAAGEGQRLRSCLNETDLADIDKAMRAMSRTEGDWLPNEAEKRNKLLLPLQGIPLFVYSLRAFLLHSRIDKVVVVASETFLSSYQRLVKQFITPFLSTKALTWTIGGNERMDSVSAGLNALQVAPAQVLIHDGARPLTSQALIDRVLSALEANAAVVPILPVTDTLRTFTDEGSQVMSRDGLYHSQTPQGFEWNTLWNAHQLARKNQWQSSDDAQLVEQAGQTMVAGVHGEVQNIKVTTLPDWHLANAWAGTLQTAQAFYPADEHVG